MNILITGGAGFIGSHLTERLLREGNSIITIIDDFNDYYDPKTKYRNIASFPGEGVCIETIDIRDTEEVERVIANNKPDLIIHLAARAGVRPSLKDPVLYTSVNVDGTIGILELARKYGIKKFIFASSSSVYGNTDSVPFREDNHNIQPISPYGVSKLAGEYYCRVYSKVYGLDIIALRFFTVYGPRQRPDMAIHKFTRLIYEGKDIEMYGDGSTKRDYTFITDILDGISGSINRLLQVDGFGFEPYNLGESQTVELICLVELIEKALGKKARVKRLPEQTGDVRLTYSDISKARQNLCYNPQVKIEDGIPEFVKWFKANL